MKIGFLGLGAMGRGMVANLLKAGHEVTVWNRSPGPAGALAAQGARVAATPAEALKGEVALSILADDAAALSVVDETALAQAAPGLVHGCMATVSIEAVRKMMDSHARASVGYVGAPVFGRGDVAAAGKLNIIASGAAADIARLQPAFDAMGQKTWVVGTDPAHAHTVKIAGNLMIATAIELLGETFALCEKSGVDPKAFAEIMTSTIFAAPVFKNYAALITNKAYEPAGFKMTLGLKDATLALAAGNGTNTPLPLASLLRDHYLEALAHGDANKDWAALAEVSARKAGLGT
jgi:3-hydroxyisobutyrate dehydrogenase-like beta-hydroxyacid dehydrogenase